jgi:hypothetical protein
VVNDALEVARCQRARLPLAASNARLARALGALELDWYVHFVSFVVGYRKPFIVLMRGF